MYSMSNTAPIPVITYEENLADGMDDVTMAAIFNVMRILKRVNPGDTYLEQYQSMRKRYGENFRDTYELLWLIGTQYAPKRILEIGSRTGISLCQLLSSYVDLSVIEKIVCVDPFDEWTSANLVRANLKYLNLPHDPDTVKIYAMKSEDYFKMDEKDNRFDYILVDGDHLKEAAAADLEAAQAFLAPGGIMVFDDISKAPGECALIDVWEAFKAAHKSEFVFNELMEGKGVEI